MRRFWLLAAIGCILHAMAFGQARDTGSIFGTVTDAQAAVIPGAPVELVNPATGFKRNVTTDASGGFVFPLLPVGTYNVTIAQTGFRKYERRGKIGRAHV